MIFELRKRLTLRNKKGEITYDSGDQPSNSFTSQFLGNLQSIAGNVAVPRPEVKSTTGANFTMTDDTHWNTVDYPFSIDNDVDNDDWGLLIGDDDSTPEANSNFRLDSVIASGILAGQVNYGVTGWDAGVTTDGDEAYWSFNRTMTNNSPGVVEVKEIGAYIRVDNTPLLYCCIMRDIITPSISIPVGQTLTVQYTIKTSV